MDLQDFVSKFASLFEDTDESEFNASTNFRDMSEWDSLLALSIMAMVDEEYDVTLKGDDIRLSTTIEDLFKIVKEQKG
jgi:acyl carrier protein